MSRSRVPRQSTFRADPTGHVSPERFRFATVAESPIAAIWKRVLIAISLLGAVAVITYLGRAGYIDSSTGTAPNLLASIYYATVTVTTTGYGDIVPVSDGARFMTTFVVTPLRVLFLILLVGTTLEVLASRSRFIHKLRRWQEDLADHVVVCGYGVAGRSAVQFLSENGEERQIVVIDTDAKSLDAANSHGLAAINGHSSGRDILLAAGVDKARIVVVAVGHDDEAVLTTLRARELNPTAAIVAACREECNVDLLDSSGADEVIVSSSSAGRLLGLAAEAPLSARVINDLLTAGNGLHVSERTPTAEEIGETRTGDETVIAVSRGGHIVRMTDPALGPIRPDDRLITITEKSPGPTPSVS